MIRIPRWTVFETALESTHRYTNPFWDVTVEVRLTAPSGREQTVDAFWDGVGTWRVRYCPDELGEWHWASRCSHIADSGLHAQHGRFHCVPYTGNNPLYQNGPLRLSEDRRHFVHTNGKPFFWLGDTAWNGVLRSTKADWHHYLQTRHQQSFTAIQFVGTQWRGCSRDPLGETAFGCTDRIRLSPQFFQRLDPKVAAINAHGLVAAPVLLWALQNDDPGQALSEVAAIRLVRYLVARWGAYSVVWILGGDGDYKGERSARWKRIGNAVWGQRHDRLVTMHPCGQQWVGDEFRGEPWFDFVSYQSGHGDASDHLHWLVAGPPASEWDREPALPVINLEPNYELHPAYHSRKPFTDWEVRRAAYWSLLIAPAAGVTFGHNAIWVWAQEPEVPDGHTAIGTVPPWRAGLDTPGVRSMAVLRRFFDALPWWDLRPGPELLAEQPGQRDPHRFIAAAMLNDGSLAAVYLPQGGDLQLRTALLRLPALARWFNPRTAEWTAAGQVNQAVHTFVTPDAGDWILCIGAT
jgi:hypothetical protein